jgi:hypothetical protein
MTTKISIPFAALVLFGCQQTQPMDSPEVLKQILFDYYDGIKVKDLRKLNAVTTDNFILFEDGKVWNNDSLVTNLNKYYKTFDASFSQDSFHIKVDHTSGSMRYFSHCDCIINGTPTTFDWIESASFVKVDGAWKMNFLHSTVRK